MCMCTGSMINDTRHVNTDTCTQPYIQYVQCNLHITGSARGSKRSICVNVDYICMNNHIYSTLFKTQERESDRRSKEVEQRKESQKHTNKTTRTCDPKY